MPQPKPEPLPTPENPETDVPEPIPGDPQPSPDQQIHDPPVFPECAGATGDNKGGVLFDETEAIG